ncbi:MAG: hydroxyisourate hydrolase [Nitrospiraceae bacterium]
MGGTTRHVLDLAKGRLAFDIATYFQVQRLDLFYPDISIVFTVRDPSQHCHISLRLSPFGYAT